MEEEFDGPESYVPEPQETVGPGETSGRPRKDKKPPKPRKKKNIFKLFLIDVLTTGIILCTFAMFHHVLPYVQAKRAGTAAVSETAEMTADASEDTAAAAPEETAVPETTPETTPEITVEVTPEPEATPEPTPEATPEPEELTWAEKFADKFTDEVVITDTTYTSPDISITITKVRTEYTDVAQTNIYVADIYLADINALQTCFAGGSFTYYGDEAALSLASRAGSVLAINADYADRALAGFVVRNGAELYDEVTVEDICVIYADGSVGMYGGSSYDPADIEAMSPYQSFKFGPILVENGTACTDFNSTNELINEEAPRTAFGYYEPGHYCFVVAEGRLSDSRGLEMNRLADFMAGLGVESAYNLDGGASSYMIFNGNVVNTPANGGRNLGDILLIAEPSGDGKGDAQS